MSQTPAKKILLQKRSAHSKQSTVGVYLRLRPLDHGKAALQKINDHQVETNPPDGTRPKEYTFTKVFDNARQSEIYNEVAHPVVEQLIKGSKDGLIFTYGITGSGKTYTMEGTPSEPGLIRRTIDYVFKVIGSQQTDKGVIVPGNCNQYKISSSGRMYPNLQSQEYQSAKPSVVKSQKPVYYCLFMSLIELYNKQVIDLLEDSSQSRAGSRRLEIRKDERGMPYVAYVTEIEVKTAEKALEVYSRGVKQRKTNCTALNHESSRGHCVLTLKLIRVSKNYLDQFDQNTLVSSQLCLVDLAGSERAKRSGATGGALREAGNINNSLGALRRCIEALLKSESTANFPYREHSLTRLFRSYFEGYGSVRMVLCVKPTADDFFENNIAMEFGIQTQHVPVDYASPVKILRRSRGCFEDDPKFANLYEYLDMGGMTLREPDPDPTIDDRQFIANWINILKSRYANKRKYIETFERAQKEVRDNIVKTQKEIELLKKSLSEETIAKRQHNEARKDFTKYVYSSPTKHEHQNYPRVFEASEPSTSTKESNSPPMTNSSMEYHEQAPTAPAAKSPVMSPTSANVSASGGAPLVNPRHNRSLSCSSMQWIHHKPTGTIDTGTVLKPKFKNGRSVRNLKSSDILRKDAAGYSVVHQDADPNGEVETSIYKGHILTTVCGGAQVILNDIETMRQASPKRKRALSDAQ